MEGHAFTNIQNGLVEVEDIPEEVEKKAYDNIFLDEITLGASVFCQLSLNLIDLPLTHLELINWDQPSVVHADEFSIEHALLNFMGEKTPHKQPPQPSAYVYKLDPTGYFGKEKIAKMIKRKNTKRKKEQKKYPLVKTLLEHHWIIQKMKSK